jgi:hypothetical protein
MLLLAPMAVAGFSSEVGPTVTGVHAVAGTHAVVAFVVGPPVNGVHALAFVHAVAGTLAVTGISAVICPTVACVIAS